MIEIKLTGEDAISFLVDQHKEATDELRNHLTIAVGQIDMLEAKLEAKEPSKKRWVKAKLIDGDINKMLNTKGREVITAKYIKWYYNQDKDELYEKMNTEKFYYKRQVRELKK